MRILSYAFGSIGVMMWTMMGAAGVFSTEPSFVFVEGSFTKDEGIAIRGIVLLVSAFVGAGVCIMHATRFGTRFLNAALLVATGVVPTIYCNLAAPFAFLTVASGLFALLERPPPPEKPAPSKITT